MLVDPSEKFDGINGNGRCPVSDAATERLRVDAYWSWLERGMTSVIRAGGGKEFARTKCGIWRVFEVAGANAADYEAAWMQHSIGHSFGKYSQLGRIFSLRDEEGRPQVTFLVVNKEDLSEKQRHDFARAYVLGQANFVVHARQRDNRPLTEGQYDVLAELGAELGWDMTMLDEGSRPSKDTPQLALF